jgi:hypothetical protein
MHGPRTETVNGERTMTVTGPITQSATTTIDIHATGAGSYTSEASLKLAVNGSILEEAQGTGCVVANRYDPSDSTRMS